MKNVPIKRILSILLVFAMVVGYIPSTAIAGWDDGAECEFCGGYRFDDWLCDCGPHCSENSDSVDCYLAHHCANCLEACEADEKCDECEFCPECWEEHCTMCGVHVDGLCDGCNVCDTCQIVMGTHCYECGECMSELSECSDHPFNIYQDNHCEFCSMQCSECGMCFSGEYEDVFCESCSFCFSCAVDYGLHCPKCYECKEGEICDECKICPECGIEEVTHCPECGEHVEEWCDRGGEGYHCYNCADEFRCDQCGECTTCAEVDFCPECGVCEDCCRDNANDQGCSCGEYCAESSDFVEHFCDDCGTCFDENEKCEICGYCVECCAAQSECTDGICIEDIDYDDHFCEDCGACFHDVEACEECYDAGELLCIECCAALTENTGCEHEYCVNGWKWDEHYCVICNKCFDNCEHEPVVHDHEYGADGNCTICGVNKDGKPMIVRHPKSVVAMASKNEYVEFTVEAVGGTEYQWYYLNPNTQAPVEIGDDSTFQGAKTSTLEVCVSYNMCTAPTLTIYCVVLNEKGNVLTDKVTFSVEHEYDKYTTNDTNHWKKCLYCTNTVENETHIFDGWTILATPTKEDKGLKQRKCIVCGVIDKEILPVIPEAHVHDYTYDYGENVTYHWEMCECGAENKAEMEKHTFGQWQTTSQPTISTKGEQVRACTVCGYEEKQTLDPQGHTHEFYDEAYLENHKDNGNYGNILDEEGYIINLYHEPLGKTDRNYHYAYCVVDGCDAYVKECHRWETIWYDIPTETQDGTYERRCTECFYTIPDGTSPAGKYRVITKDCKASTQAAKPGSKVRITPYSDYPAGYYFEEVDVTYTYGGGASGTWERVTVSYHEPDAEDTKAYWYFTMPDLPDGANWETFYVEVEGITYECEDHDFELINVKEANCGEPGYTGDYVCKKCNYVEEYGQATPITGEPHSAIYQEESVEGSCDKNGYIGAKYCGVCNKVVEPRDYTGKVHKVTVSKDSVAATCTSKGSTKEFACSKCWTVLKRSTATPKLPHDWEVYQATVTCTSKGQVAYWKCKDCGQISVDNGVTILRNTNRLNSDALGHSFGKWQSIDGTTHKRICGNNNDHIETANHNFVGDICSDCGYDKHVCSPKVVKAKAATCTANGNIAHWKCDKCSKCFEDSNGKRAIDASKTVINKLGHSYSDSYTVDKAATLSSDGTMSKHCKRSGCTSKKSQQSINKIASVNLSATKYLYDGKAHTPSVTVKDSKGKVLVKGTDYTVTYPSGMINAGTYKVKVAFKGKYSTVVEKSFSITPKDLSKFTATISQPSFAYTGDNIKPVVTVKGTVNGKTVTLTNWKDYKVTYKNFKNPGTATIIVTGRGNYAGEIQLNFTIRPIDISKFSATISQPTFTYTGDYIKPVVTVKGTALGKTVTLTNWKDYKVTYSNFKNPGQATITITGRGIYGGTKKINFYIRPSQVKKLKYVGSSTTYTSFKWDACVGVTGYEVYRATSKNGTYTKVATVSATTYKNTGLKTKTTYYYKVRAYKKITGNTLYSAWSDVKSFSTK